MNFLDELVIATGSDAYVSKLTLKGFDLCISTLDSNHDTYDRYYISA